MTWKMKGILICAVPFLMASKELVVHDGYLSIRNTTKIPLMFQYMGASQSCVFVPNAKPIELNPNEGIFFPIQFTEPCEAKLKFRVLKIEQVFQVVDLLPNFISKERLQQIIRQQKHPTKVL